MLQVDRLKSLLELVVNKGPQLCTPILPDVLNLHVDCAAAVRKYLPDFMEAVVAVHPSAEVLQQCLQCLSSLVGDSTPAVSKRAIGASYTVFRSALLFVAHPVTTHFNAFLTRIGGTLMQSKPLSLHCTGGWSPGWRSCPQHMVCRAEARS